MIELQKLITSKLKEIPQIANQKQFYSIAIDKSAFPQVIFNFRNANEDYPRSDIILEIDIWHSNKNLIDLEMISDLVDDKLNRLKYLDDSIQISIYRLNPYKLYLDDEDKTVKRRQLRYILKTYKF